MRSGISRRWMESVSVRRPIMRRRGSVKSVECFWIAMRVTKRIIVLSVRMRVILIPSRLMASVSANNPSGWISLNASNAQQLSKTASTARKTVNNANNAKAPPANPPLTNPNANASPTTTKTQPTTPVNSATNTKPASNAHSKIHQSAPNATPPKDANSHHKMVSVSARMGTMMIIKADA